MNDLTNKPRKQDRAITFLTQEEVQRLSKWCHFPLALVPDVE